MISRSAIFAALATLACAPLWATVFTLPEDGSAVVGEDAHIQSKYQDTLLDIARRYSLGYEEIIRANPGTDMWIPGEGKDIFLPGRRILPPGPREGIVVNLPEHRIYYYPKPKKHEKPVVITFPVSIGKMDWRTPLGETRVITKVKHPNWYPPESVRKEHEANGDPLPKIVKVEIVNVELPAKYIVAPAPSAEVFNCNDVAVKLDVNVIPAELLFEEIIAPND